VCINKIEFRFNFVIIKVLRDIFFNSSLEVIPVNVTSQIVLNNLVEVDEVLQLVTLDLKFRLYWFDDRFNVTIALFKALNPSYTLNGIDMTFIHASGQLKIWLPDLDFSDAQTVTELQTSLRLKPYGLVYWSRHLSLTLSQTSFDYSMYPLDTLSALRATHFHQSLSSWHGPRPQFSCTIVEVESLSRRILSGLTIATLRLLTKWITR
jgi:hypothetical protein